MKTRARISRPTAFAVVVLLAAGLLAACGGGNDTAGPSSAQGVTLRGTVVADVFGAASAGRASAATLTVSVVELPGSEVTVGSDGTFTLRGLPAGQFTLVFKLDGVQVATQTFDSVAPNQEIVITVAVSGTTVTVVEEMRNGIGHGNVELQGTIESVVAVNPAGDSRFVIRGRTVIVRPAQTSIVSGNGARTVNDLVVGQRVHVKGAWQPPSGTAAQEILAHLIRIQAASEGPGDVGRACVIEGGRVGERIELEGRVQAGNWSAFRLLPNGSARGPVEVRAGSASFECSPASGPNAPTLDQCKAKVSSGARVHVRGTLSSCDSTSAQVEASSVRVQGQ